MYQINSESEDLIVVRDSLETLVPRVSTLETLAHIVYRYGVALVSRIDKVIGLFCKRAL